MNSRLILGLFGPAVLGHGLIQYYCDQVLLLWHTKAQDKSSSNDGHFHNCNLVPYIKCP